MDDPGSLRPQNIDLQLVANSPGVFAHRYNDSLLFHAGSRSTTR